MYQDPVKNKNKGPIDTVEVFTKKGTDAQECKDHILETTGTVPGIYDKGTHYITHMRVTLEILKKLNDFDYVMGVVHRWELGMILEISRKDTKRLTLGKRIYHKMRHYDITLLYSMKK